MPASRKTSDRAAADRSERQRRRGAQQPARWIEVSDASILRAVRSVSENGGMVAFGKTSDGGALALYVWGDGQPYKEYFRPGQDVDGYLHDLAQDFEGGGVPPADRGTPGTHPQAPGASGKPFRTSEEFQQELFAKLDAMPKQEDTDPPAM